MLLFKTYLLITRWKTLLKEQTQIIAPTWNGEFELPDASYSVSDIQDYIEYITKKHETLTIISSIYIYICRTDNRLCLK